MRQPGTFSLLWSLWRGEWRGDEIRALGELITHARTATVTTSRSSPPPEAPPPVRYTLRRGSEKDFLAACGSVEMNCSVAFTLDALASCPKGLGVRP